jgi:hypothetical protein
MKRALLLGSVLVLVAACGGKKTFDSVCANQVPPPAACNTSCDPAAGSTTACPSGYHCNAGGKCDAVCTPGGTECGSGFACTADGYCVDDGSGGGGDVDACPSVHFTAAKTTPSIQLLIDRSGSMLNNFADTAPNNNNSNGPYKYPTEVTALAGAQGVVTTLQGSVYFGASMYPSNACPAVLRVGRALNNAAAITTFLNNNPPYSDPAQGIQRTPTPTAIDAVVADFQDNPPPAGSPPIILLATDGLPNSCMSDTRTTSESVAAAANAYAKGIRVFVLSVGDTTGTADHFLKLANAGQGVTAGQPNAKYYPASSPAQLQAAFNEIISGVLSCDLQLSGPVKPDEAQSGTVTLNGSPLKYGTDWSVAADGLTLRILGNACTTLKNSANPAVDATFSCNAVIIF